MVILLDILWVVLKWIIFRKRSKGWLKEMESSGEIDKRLKIYLGY